MGSLAVIVDGQPVWKKTGNQGNVWKDGLVDLSSYTGKNPTVAFESVRNDWSGDAAIDAVKFVKKKVAVFAPKAGCSFETNFCVWTNSKAGAATNIFSWTRKSGPTSSPKTGPSKAADKNWYVYTEASKPRKKGDKAILTSPPLLLPQPMVLQFKYHMHGEYMGSLAVIVDGQTVWKKTGNQGDVWKDGLVDLSSYTGKNPTVAFESVRNDWSGDAAIDAVKFVKKKVVVTIGRSNKRTKCVKFKNADCPADSGNRNKRKNPDNNNANDAFMISRHQEYICAYRTDRNLGWGMNLQLECFAEA